MPRVSKQTPDCCILMTALNLEFSCGALIYDDVSELTFCRWALPHAVFAFNYWSNHIFADIDGIHFLIMHFSMQTMGAMVLALNQFDVIRSLLRITPNRLLFSRMNMSLRLWNARRIYRVPDLKQFRKPLNNNWSGCIAPTCHTIRS